MIFQRDCGLRDRRRHLLQGHVGAVAAERPGINALIEKMLTGAVVESNRFKLFLLPFDHAGVWELRGIKRVDGEHTGDGHTDRAANSQEESEKQRRRPLEKPEPGTDAVGSGPLTPPALYEDPSGAARASGAAHRDRDLSAPSQHSRFVD